MGFLDSREIVLGVTGGIAAYKAAFLARELMRNGAAVTTVMTAPARQFITPLTFEALTERPCRTDEDQFGGARGQTHVSLARGKDLIVIAPATATTIARLAAGSAENMLTATVLASTCPVVISPAMHTQMWLSLPVQRNLETLRKDPRYVIVPPDDGELASGDKGPGRLPDIGRIVEYCIAALTPQTLKGRTVVVTGGPTREPIDPVRVITNPSSGKMGICLARAAGRRGADVRLILGPCAQEPDMDAPGGSWTVTNVCTTAQMLKAVRKAIKDADALVMSAAPADERPVTMAAGKIAKEGFGDSIAVEPNPDILATLAPMTATMTVMAFAAETAVSADAAAAKMRRKGADLLFANPAGDGRGFGEVPDEGLLVRASGGESKPFPPMPKEMLADLLMDELVAVMKGRR